MRLALRSLRTLTLCLTLCAAVATVSACNRETTETPPSGDPKQVDVVMRANSFEPATVTIARGGSVTWINNDIIEYSLVSDGNFEELIKPGERNTRTFPNAGEYRVYDNISSIPFEMRVIVR